MDSLCLYADDVVIIAPHVPQRPHTNVTVIPFYQLFLILGLSFFYNEENSIPPKREYLKEEPKGRGCDISESTKLTLLDFWADACSDRWQASEATFTRVQIQQLIWCQQNTPDPWPYVLTSELARQTEFRMNGFDGLLIRTTSTNRKLSICVKVYFYNPTPVKLFTFYSCTLWLKLLITRWCHVCDFSPLL